MESITLTTKQWKEMFPGICPIGMKSGKGSVIVGISATSRSWLCNPSNSFNMQEDELTFPIPTLISHVLGELVKTVRPECKPGKTRRALYFPESQVAIIDEDGNPHLRYAPGAADLMQNKTFTMDENNKWSEQ